MMHPTRVILRSDVLSQKKLFVIRNTMSEQVVTKITSNATKPFQFDHYAVVIDGMKYEEIKMTVDKEALEAASKTKTFLYFYVRPISQNASDLCYWIQANTHPLHQLAFKLEIILSSCEFSAGRIILDLPGSASDTEFIGKILKSTDRSVIDQLLVKETKVASSYNDNDYIPQNNSSQINKEESGLLNTLLKRRSVSNKK